MQDRGLHKTFRGQYVPAEWNCKNEAGWKPINDCVLVRPDKAADKVGTIIIPEGEVYTQQLAAEAGVIVALGDGAFVWDSLRQRKFEGARPEPGRRVSFEPYSGAKVMGDDGELYFTMRDRSIGAVKI